MLRKKMRVYEKKRLAWGLFLLVLFSFANGRAQWSEFKKGLQKDVKVAVESDSMLVAHHSAINFSFIATIQQNINSDIYLSEDSASSKNSEKIWKTTERFWNRLQKNNYRLETIFLPGYLNRFRHPENLQGNPTSDASGGGDQLLPIPRKTLIERIHEARERGDFEVASLLSMMAQQANTDSASMAVQAVSPELQQRLKHEKAVLEKMYESAREYERAGDLSMATAVYENLLVLGEYRDARTRLATILPKQQHYADSLKIVQKREAGQEAMAAGDWSAAIVAFEAVLSHDPGDRQARKQLALARRALGSVEKIILSANSKNRPVSATNGLHSRNTIPDDQIRYLSHDSSLADSIQPLAADPDQLAAGLYDQAKFYIRQGKWQNAHTTLQMLGVKNARYRDTQQLMQLVERRLAAQHGWPWKWGWGWLFWVSAFLAAAVFAGSSPSIRAAWWFALRKYHKAEAIYENQLAKNPGKIKLFGKLAQVYLKTNRRDKKAMKVFGIIQKLNLKVKNRQAMERMLEHSRIH